MPGIKMLDCIHIQISSPGSVWIRSFSLFPDLSVWYKAMPACAYLFQGDAASWHKVLALAGYGNTGSPPQIHIGQPMEIELVFEKDKPLAKDDNKMTKIWSDCASTRSYLASSPAAQAAMIVKQNRRAIMEGF